MSSLVVGVLFLVSAVVAVIGEGYLGELGGPLGFCSFWGLVIFVICIITGR